jgi:hypothetical protein
VWSKTGQSPLDQDAQLIDKPFTAHALLLKVREVLDQRPREDTSLRGDACS